MRLLNLSRADEAISVTVLSIQNTNHRNPHQQLKSMKLIKNVPGYWKNTHYYLLHQCTTHSVTDSADFPLSVSNISLSIVSKGSHIFVRPVDIKFISLCLWVSWISNIKYSAPEPTVVRKHFMPNKWFILSWLRGPRAKCFLVLFPSPSWSAMVSSMAIRINSRTMLWTKKIKRINPAPYEPQTGKQYGLKNVKTNKAFKLFGFCYFYRSGLYHLKTEVGLQK